MGLSKQRADGESCVPEVFEPCCGLYPGVSSFTGEYDETDYRDWVLRSNGDPVPAPLMLVVEDSVGAEGGADNGVRSLNASSYVTREIHLQGSLFDRDRLLEGVVCAPAVSHGWSNDALYELSSGIQEAFSMAPPAFARWCACFGRSSPDIARLQLLRVLGFSKVRLGMDLSPLSGKEADQAAEFARVGELLGEARALGYRSIAIDLELPRLLSASLADRLERFAADCHPECLRLFIGSGQGADPDSRLAALRNTFLPGLGYRHLGLDWYVSVDEPSLGGATCLYWSPLGYTDIDGLDIIGVGPGAVSVLEDACSQNAVRPADYRQRVEQDEIPTGRGIELESDDVLRRSVMSGLLLNERFNVEALEERWGILFSRYFENEASALRELEQRGRLVFGEREIHTLDRSRETLETLCRIFDNQERIARVPPLRDVQPPVQSPRLVE